jgi:hypothetical protein
VPYRFIYVGLGLLAVAVVALGIAFAQEGDAVELPDPIEAVSPLPGDSVIRQTSVEIDLAVGYVAEIFVDGFPVEATFVEATGVYSWSPAPNSAVMNEWTPGDHTVRVEWRSISGSPDFGSFEWTFRVQ